MICLHSTENFRYGCCSWCCFCFHGGWCVVHFSIDSTKINLSEWNLLLNLILFLLYNFLTHSQYSTHSDESRLVTCNFAYNFLILSHFRCSHVHLIYAEYSLSYHWVNFTKSSIYFIFCISEKTFLFVLVSFGKERMKNGVKLCKT